jgi:hypothetical protein
MFAVWVMRKQNDTRLDMRIPNLTSRILAPSQDIHLREHSVIIAWLEGIY